MLIIVIRIASYILYYICRLKSKVFCFGESTIWPCFFSSASSLTGKAIEHRFIENGKNKLYKGRVISYVPGFPDWFNVVYNDEPGVVYSYKLSED